jgi:hypothetical protein
MTMTTMEFSLDVPPQARQVLSQLGERAGVPVEFLRISEAHFVNGTRVRSEQFAAPKERERLAAVDETTTQALLEQVRATEEQARALRDRRLADIDQEVAKADRIPSRPPMSTADEHQAELTRMAIREARQTQQLIAASMDLALALSTTDVAMLQAIVDDAFTSGHPERIRQVCRAAEGRLRTLTEDEARSGRIAPGATTATREAYTAVSTRAKAWRETQAAAAPDASRARARDEYDGTVRGSIRHALHAATAAGSGVREQLGRRLAQGPFAPFAILT